MKLLVPTALGLLAGATAVVAGGARGAILGISQRTHHRFTVADAPPLDIAIAATAALSRTENDGLGKIVAVPAGGEVKRNIKIGVLGVLGGALCHIVLGTTYCWGNFLPYIPAKLKYFKGAEGSGPPDAMWVLAGTFVAQALAMPIGPSFQEKIGCKATTMLGCGLMALGVFLASFAPNLYVFLFCYSLLFGSGVGIAYTAPMVNGWRWFPDKKGLVSGAVVAGFGSGGFIFNQVGTKIINPDGLDAVGGVYPDTVYEMFPKMLRKLSFIYIVLSGVGALFVNPPPAEALGTPSSGKKAAAAPASTGSSLREALVSKNFWLMWFMVLLIATSGINVANVYKQFAGTVDVLQSDSFQSVVGSVAALCNGFGRLFWGNMLDMFGFKKPFATMAAIQASVTFLYTTLAKSKVGYLVATGLLLFTLGGNFAMFPALTSKVFGAREGARIYGVLFTAFAMASISATFLTKQLQSWFGWEWDAIFKLMSFLTVVALGALPIFNGVS